MACEIAVRDYYYSTTTIPSLRILLFTLLLLLTKGVDESVAFTLRKRASFSSLTREDIPLVAPTIPHACFSLRFGQQFAPTRVSRIFFFSSSSSAAATTGDDHENGAKHSAAAVAAAASENYEPTRERVDEVFDDVDLDGSGSIDLDEFQQHLSSVGYSKDSIMNAFSEMDLDDSGEISRDEFRRAILKIASSTSAAAAKNDDNDITISDPCPIGYFLNTVKQRCEPLGPIGRISQRVEMLGPFRHTYQKISNLFNIDTKRISKLGVSFALAYSIISNLNGALSLTMAWYISIKRTGLPPGNPSQWKNLATSYAMIYGAIQVLRPFRVAAAIAMSKLSAEYLQMIQKKLKCSRAVAIGVQYIMGQLIMCCCAFIGVSIVSIATGTPMFAR